MKFQQYIENAATSSCSFTDVMYYKCFTEKVVSEVPLCDVFHGLSLRRMLGIHYRANRQRLYKSSCLLQCLSFLVCYYNRL